MKKRNNQTSGALTGSVIDEAPPKKVIINHKPIKLTPVTPEEMVARRIPAYKLLIP